MASNGGERTLVLIKPDAVRRGLVGEIIGRFERKGPGDRGDAAADHGRRRPTGHTPSTWTRDFYPPLKRFMTSGPLVAVVLSGDSAIEVVRTLTGVTDGRKAAPARSVAT